jgi:hemerythrin superfamily protein
VKNARSAQTKDEVREAYQEHKKVKKFLAELDKMSPDVKGYDSKVQELQALVEHHVGEEESEMFPDAKKFLGEEELEKLGEQLMERKESLESASK